MYGKEKTLRGADRAYGPVPLAGSFHTQLDAGTIVKSPLG